MDAISRRLLFRIGTIRFCLYLNELIEIRNQTDSLYECRQPDFPLVTVDAFTVGQAQIPVVELYGRLSLLPVEAESLLVLSSLGGRWALVVDRVEGFCSKAEMKDLPVPPLLRVEGWRCFQRISLYQGVPYLCLDLDACYGGEPE